jgi:hypothetical protein
MCVIFHHQCYSVRVDEGFHHQPLSWGMGGTMITALPIKRAKDTSSLVLANKFGAMNSKINILFSFVQMLTKQSIVG